EMMVETSELFKSPTRKGRSLIIDKNSPVFHFWLSIGVLSSKNIKVLLVLYRHICPPIPRRNDNLLRKIINAKNSSSFVASNDDQSANHAFHGLFYYLDEMGFPLTGNAGHIQFLAFYQLVNYWTFPQGS